MNSALRFHAINNYRKRRKDEENRQRKNTKLWKHSIAETFEEEEERYKMIMDLRKYVRGRSSNDIQREENDSNGCLIATVFLLLILLGLLSYLT